MSLKYKMKTENLHVYFGRKHVLKGITLGIIRNKVNTIIGPSGCGKTTFIRTLNRLNDLVKDFRMSGKVYLDDVDIYGNGIDVYELRKRVGMVFQTPNPFPMSIYDNVAYGPRIHGVKDRKELDRIVRESLIKAGLWEEVKDRLNESALKLSGGQKQRLCIARCLAVEPEVILMDEPTSALDPLSAARIEDLIVSLKKDYTVVLVTHNIHMAARVSDYVAFLYNGELIEHGQASVIFKTPRYRLTELYLTRRLTNQPLKEKALESSIEVKIR